MAAVDAVISAKNSRWESIIRLTGLLSEGKVVLEDLVTQSKSPNLALELGFLMKRKRSPRKHNTPIKKRKLSWFLESSPVFRTPIKKQSGAIDSNPNSLCQIIPIKNPRAGLIIPATTSDRSPYRILLERKPFFDKPIKKKQSGPNSNSACLKKSNKPNPRLLMDQHIINDIQNPQPSLPEAIRGRIIETGGCLESAVVVIEKALYPTDVDPNQCRLSVPIRQVKERFLLAGEVDTLLDSEEGGNIGTTLIEPCLDERQITFGLWKSNAMYVMKGWKDIMKKNGLRQGMVVRLWAFRRNLQLCFALETR